MKEAHFTIAGSFGILVVAVLLILANFQVAAASEGGFQDTMWLQDPTFSPEQGTEDTVFEFSVTYFNTVNTGPLPVFEPVEPAFPESLKALNDDMHARKAVDGGDTTHIVWMREDAGGIYEIFYAKIGPLGTLIRPPMQISDPDGIYSMYPSIALDSGNNAHVVWVDFRHSTSLMHPLHPNAEIYYSQVSPGGVDIPDVLISLDDGISSGYDPDVATASVPPPLDHRWSIFFEHPDIAVDAADNVHIVWSDARHSVKLDTLRQWEVYYQQQTNAAPPVVLTDDHLISLADGFDSRCPAIAISLADTVHIVWQDARHTPAPGAGTFTRGNYNGDGWVDAQDGYDLVAMLGGSLPHPLCWDAADAEDDGDTDIHDALRIIHWLGGSVLPPPPPFPNCGPDPTPDVLDCNTPSCVSQWEIYYQKQTAAWPNPAVIVNDKLISAPPDGFNSTMPDIDVEDIDRYVHIVFMDQRNQDPGHTNTHQFDATLNQNYWEVYSAILTPGGQFVTDPLINPTHGPKRQSDMSGGGWYGIYTASPDGYSMYPRVAVDDVHQGGSTHITWHDDRNGNWQIYHTQVPNRCNSPAADVRVPTNNANRDMYPDIALNSSGQPDIAWQYEDLTMGRWRIFHILEANAGIWVTLFRSKSAPQEGATFRMFRADPSDSNAADGIRYMVTTSLPAGSYALSFSAQDTAGNEADTSGIPGLMAHPAMEFIRGDAEADDPPGPAEYDVDLFDGLRVIYYVGGTAPEPPPPNLTTGCGMDPTPDDLFCESFPPCGWNPLPAAKTSIVGAAEASRLVLEQVVPDGRTAVVPVTLANAEPLAGFSFAVEYDPELVTATVVDNAGLVTEGFDVFAAGVSEPGLVKVAAVSDMNIADGVEKLPVGEHQVARIVFELSEKAPRQDISLKVVNSIMAISHNQALSHQVVVKGTPELPTEFHLAQNYPNPFNPITEITYALPKNSHVRLEIYNILGQRVATLVDEHQKAGYKSVHWDSRSVSDDEVSSGLYFYRLQAGDFVETRKMILLR